MGSQYGDGLRGLFIIEYDNDDEYNKEFPYDYDEDVTLSVGRSLSFGITRNC